MDTTTVAVIASIIVAIVAIVPNVIGLRNQRKADDAKARADDKRADLEANTAASQATMNVVTTLQNELARVQADNSRYQTRIVELETDAIVKTEKLGKVMQEKIDRENDLLTMKYKYDAMELKLQRYTVMEEAEGKVAVVPRRKKEDTVPLAVKQEMENNMRRKVQIAEDTDKEIQELKGKSVNGTSFEVNIPE